MHDRDTDDGNHVIGAKLRINEVHSMAIIETEKRAINDSLRNNYWNRIQHIIDFWKEEYPEFHALGVQQLGARELSDPVQHWHKCKQDIKYTGFNVDFFKAFLAKEKKRRMVSAWVL